MSRNCLNIKQKTMLVEFCKKNAAEFQGLTLERVAELATVELGCNVTRGNVVNIRDAFELDIGRTKNIFDPASIEDIRQSVAELKKQVSDLITVVSELKQSRLALSA